MSRPTLRRTRPAPAVAKPQQTAPGLRGDASRGKVGQQPNEVRLSHFRTGASHPLQDRIDDRRGGRSRSGTQERCKPSHSGPVPVAQQVGDCRGEHARFAGIEDADDHRGAGEGWVAFVPPGYSFFPQPEVLLERVGVRRQHPELGGPGRRGRRAGSRRLRRRLSVSRRLHSREGIAEPRNRRSTCRIWGGTSPAERCPKRFQYLAAGVTVQALIFDQRSPDGLLAEVAVGRDEAVYPAPPPRRYLPVFRLSRSRSLSPEERLGRADVPCPG